MANPHEVSEPDTETLIGLVSSLLSRDNLEQYLILDALAEHDGDADAAAAFLNRSAKPTIVGAGKRKSSSDLDNWIKPISKRNRKEVKEEDISSSTSSRASFRIPPTTSMSSSSSKTVDLMTVLKPPSSAPKKNALQKLPPLTLTTPALISKHTPCTLHHSVLPPDLACELFYTMLDLSKDWQRNKWWLFDRVVESPHRTSFFARRTNGLDSDESWQEAAKYWYNGRMTDPPLMFPDPMERACTIIERIVNEEISKRPRYGQEWVPPDTSHGPGWRANVAASNCYEGSKESVGWHSDQLTYLGPFPTIASLSLGTKRVFSLREVIPAQEQEARQGRTLNIPLPHNSLTIMHASCQETFKHSIPPQNSIDLYRPAFPRAPGQDIEPSKCRINITFRFYRPDFRPETTPKCYCGVPTILRPDMKRRVDNRPEKFWWACYAGVQNEGKGCNFWKVMGMSAEVRGSRYSNFLGHTSGGEHAK